MQRVLSRIVGAAVLVAGAGVLGVATGAGPALASECGGGTYTEITSHTTIYHVVYGPYHDDNGTTSSATDSFSNDWKGTVTSKVDASADVSVGTVIAQAKVSVSKSITKSQGVTIGHKITYHIPAHKSLHVEYAVTQRRVHVHHYSQNLACHVYNSHWGYANLDDGVGWHSWLTSYSG